MLACRNKAVLFRDTSSALQKSNHSCWHVVAIYSHDIGSSDFARGVGTPRAVSHACHVGEIRWLVAESGRLARPSGAAS